MKPYCFSIDSIIPSSSASIHPLDIGLIRGYAIFDFFRSVNFQPLFLDDYLDRFIRSAEKTRLPLKYSREKLKDIILVLIQKNQLEFGGIRMVLSGGISMDYFSPSTGNLYIFCEELNMPVAKKYELGVKLRSLEYLRPIADVKTTNYTLAVMASADWKSEEIEDVMYHHEGVISECSRSNLFMVKNGVISTPKKNILYGITRKYVIELAEGVEERDIALKEIMEADEVFLTSSTKRILPIKQIDDQLIGMGNPGPVTRQMMVRLKELEEKISV
ncbi:aminotransferase class IV [Pararhodonellum marinum]|uniref:aminotransferase class IV n=1 Tax=Pararhodonellum marinum TaxID=2755358 RepID=UPI00188FD36C|nr:aminotransferase class IV [Pararhodonellum marinum]